MLPPQPPLRGGPPPPRGSATGDYDPESPRHDFLTGHIGPTFSGLQHSNPLYAAPAGQSTSRLPPPPSQAPLNSAAATGVGRPHQSRIPAPGGFASATVPPPLAPLVPRTSTWPAAAPLNPSGNNVSRTMSNASGASSPGRASLLAYQAVQRPVEPVSSAPQQEEKPHQWFPQQQQQQQQQQQKEAAADGQYAAQPQSDLLPPTASEHADGWDTHTAHRFTAYGSGNYPGESDGQHHTEAHHQENQRGAMQDGWGGDAAADVQETGGEATDIKEASYHQHWGAAADAPPPQQAAFPPSDWNQRAQETHDGHHTIPALRKLPPPAASTESPFKAKFARVARAQHASSGATVGAGLPAVRRSEPHAADTITGHQAGMLTAGHAAALTSAVSSDYAPTGAMEQGNGALKMEAFSSDAPPAPASELSQQQQQYHHTGTYPPAAVPPPIGMPAKAFPSHFPSHAQVVRTDSTGSSGLGGLPRPPPLGATAPGGYVPSLPQPAGRASVEDTGTAAVSANMPGLFRPGSASSGSFLPQTSQPSSPLKSSRLGSGPPPAPLVPAPPASSSADADKGGREATASVPMRRPVRPKRRRRFFSRLTLFVALSLVISTLVGTSATVLTVTAAANVMHAGMMALRGMELPYPPSSSWNTTLGHWSPGFDAALRHVSQVSARQRRKAAEKWPCPRLAERKWTCQAMQTAAHAFYTSRVLAFDAAVFGAGNAPRAWSEVGCPAVAWMHEISTQAIALAKSLRAKEGRATMINRIRISFLEAKQLVADLAAWSQCVYQHVRSSGVRSLEHVIHPVAGCWHEKMGGYLLASSTISDSQGARPGIDKNTAEDDERGEEDGLQAPDYAMKDDHDIDYPIEKPVDAELDHAGGNVLDEAEAPPLVPPMGDDSKQSEGEEEEEDVRDAGSSPTHDENVTEAEDVDAVLEPSDGEGSMDAVQVDDSKDRPVQQEPATLPPKLEDMPHADDESDERVDDEIVSGEENVMQEGLSEATIDRLDDDAAVDVIPQVPPAPLHNATLPEQPSIQLHPDEDMDAEAVAAKEIDALHLPAVTADEPLAKDGEPAAKDEADMQQEPDEDKPAGDVTSSLPNVGDGTQQVEREIPRQLGKVWPNRRQHPRRSARGGDFTTPPSEVEPHDADADAAVPNIKAPEVVVSPGLQESSEAQSPPPPPQESGEDAASIEEDTSLETPSTPESIEAPHEDTGEEVAEDVAAHRHDLAPNEPSLDLKQQQEEEKEEKEKEDEELSDGDTVEEAASGIVDADHNIAELVLDEPVIEAAEIEDADAEQKPHDASVEDQAVAAGEQPEATEHQQGEPTVALMVAMFRSQLLALREKVTNVLQGLRALTGIQTLQGQLEQVSAHAVANKDSLRNAGGALAITVAAFLMGNAAARRGSIAGARHRTPSRRAAPPLAEPPAEEATVFRSARSIAPPEGAADDGHEVHSPPQPIRRRRAIRASAPAKLAPMLDGAQEETPTLRRGRKSTRDGAATAAAAGTTTGGRGRSRSRGRKTAAQGR